MDGGTHAEGKLNRQRESLQVLARELKSVSEVKEAVSKLGSNLLNERTFVEKLSGNHHAWLEGLQSRMDNKEAFAFDVQEDGVSVGFVLADREGVITQLRSIEGKQASTLEVALAKLKDKGLEHPRVHLSEKSEGMRRVLLDADFHEGERTEDGKTSMEKE